MNFDENIPKEPVIDWDKLKPLVPDEIDRCMAFFKGLKIEETQECLLAALRRLGDPKAALEFQVQFSNFHVLWEGISPDECLHPLRFSYVWLCSIYVAYCRRTRRFNDTRENLGPKTREVIQQHSRFMELAEKVSCCSIDADYLTKISDLHSPADRAAELQAALAMALQTDNLRFANKVLHERLQRIIQQKMQDDAAVIRRVKEMEAIVEEFNRSKVEPYRLGLLGLYEYELFTAIRTMAKTGDEEAYCTAAKLLVAELRRTGHLPCGRWMTPKGKTRLSLGLQSATSIPGVRELGLCRGEDSDAAEFLATAIDELEGTWPTPRSRFCTTTLGAGWNSW